MARSRSRTCATSTLTAPFFHNGGQLTLEQVVEFYNRGGDFAIENLGDLAPNIHPLASTQGKSMTSSRSSRR